MRSSDVGDEIVDAVDPDNGDASIQRHRHPHHLPRSLEGDLKEAAAS